MKKRIKQLTAAIMAIAMLFSLAAVASASTVPGTNDVTTLSNTPTETQSQNNTVTSQGGLPPDVINIVMPTAPANAFSLLLDAHKLLDDTNWKRYAALDGNDEDPVHDSGTLFFKNVTKTAKDKTATLTADVAGTTLKQGDKVVVYAKATVNKIYALRVTEKAYPEADGKKFSKWIKADGTDVDFTTTPYTDIAGIKSLDPTHGSGLDAIAKINADKFVDFKATNADTSSLSSSAKDMAEYSFNSYDSSDLRYVGVDKTTPDTPVDKVFSALDGTADGANSTVAALTTAGYVKQQENKGIVSYKTTSSPIQVINKSNKDIGVSMSAELKNIPGGDGTVVGEGAAAQQTYVYANSMGTGADAGKFYSDQTDTDGNPIEITNVPVIYMQLSNGTDTEVMAYDSSATKATVNISSVIPGQSAYFEKRFNAQPTADDPTAGTYFYSLDKDKKESDFITAGSSMTFQLKGAINEETANDSWWDSFTTAPTMDVTWSVKSYTPLKSPTVTPGDWPSRMRGTGSWPFTVTDNTDKAEIISIKVGTDDCTFTQTTDASTGTTAFEITVGTDQPFESQPTSGSMIVTFKDPDDPVRQTRVTVNFS